MKTEIDIGGVKVGPNYPPFLIAELSGNHNQSLDRALEIVDAAAKAGAHAVKLQTYTADTMTIDIESGDFFISDEKSPWKGYSLYSLYKEAYTPWDWHEPIMKRCADNGLLCFSTPFDNSAVDFLNALGVPCFKIASFENTCIPLLKKVAAQGKPVIMSTGMADVGELLESVNTLKENGCEDIILLKCTSNYPSLPTNAHLRTIPHMRELFKTQVGLSDHSMGCGVSVASIVFGATVIEKHFTLKRSDGGVDAAFSMEPDEFKRLSEEISRAWYSLGEVKYGTTSESRSKAFRRSVYVVQDIKAGQTFDERNIRCIRPGFGLETRYYESLIGKKANQDLKRGTRMSLSFVQLDRN